MKRGGKNILIYVFIIIGILIASSIGVLAYGTSTPATFGHTTTEMNFSGGFVIPIGNITITKGNISVKNGGINVGGGIPSSSYHGIYIRGPYDKGLSIEASHIGIDSYAAGYGIRAISSSDTGIGYGAGVYGSGISVGVHGVAAGQVGVYGECNQGWGVSGQGMIGVRGYGNSGGYDFYAQGPGTNYGAPSSIRWKKNITKIDNALVKILSIRGVYFNWDKEHGGEHDMGMIAEEVGKVIPEIVTYEENGFYATGMDYGAITPVLVEAIKEQQKQIDSLRAELCKKDKSYSWCK